MNCRDEDMYENKNLSDYLNTKLRMIKTFTALFGKFVKGDSILLN